MNDLTVLKRLAEQGVIPFGEYLKATSKVKGSLREELEGRLATVRARVSELQDKKLEVERSLKVPEGFKCVIYCPELDKLEGEAVKLSSQLERLDNKEASLQPTPEEIFENWQEMRKNGFLISLKGMP